MAILCNFTFISEPIRMKETLNFTERLLQNFSENRFKPVKPFVRLASTNAQVNIQTRTLIYLLTFCFSNLHYL